MTNSTPSLVDAFGLLDVSHKLFYRENGGWITDKWPQNAFQAPGVYQAHHGLMFSAANELQVVRDLYLLTGPDGGPFFDIYNFIGNGRILPTGNVVASPSINGVELLSLHPPGFSHPALQQALLSDAWLGKLNDDWINFKRDIISAHPTAATSTLRQLLSEQAADFAEQLHKQLAVLDYLSTARYDGSSLVSAVDLNRGVFPSFTELTTVGSPKFDLGAKTIADLAGLGLKLDAVPFDTRSNVVLDAIDKRQAFLTEAQTILQSEVDAAGKAAAIRAAATTNRVPAFDIADLNSMAQSYYGTRPDRINPVLQNRAAAVAAAVTQYIDGTVIDPASRAERLRLIADLKNMSAADVANRLNGSNSVWSTGGITADDIDVARKVIAPGERSFGVASPEGIILDAVFNNGPVNDYLTRLVSNNPLVDALRAPVPGGVLTGVRVAGDGLLLIDAAVTWAQVSEAQRYGDDLAAERAAVSFAARNLVGAGAGSIALRLIGTGLSTSWGGLVVGLGAGIIGGMGGQSIADSYYDGKFADPKSIDSRVADMAISHVLKTIQPTTIVGYDELVNRGGWQDYVSDDQLQTWRSEAEILYAKDLGARDARIVDAKQANLAAVVDGLQKLVSENPEDIAAQRVSAVIFDQGYNEFGPIAVPNPDFESQLAVNLAAVRSEQEQARQQLQTLISVYLPNGLAEGETLYGAISKNWGDAERLRLAASGQSPPSILDSLVANSGLLKYSGGPLSPETSYARVDGTLVERQDWRRDDGTTAFRFEAPTDFGSPLQNFASISEWTDNGLYRKEFRFDADTLRYDRTESSVVMFDGIVVSTRAVSGGDTWENRISTSGGGGSAFAGPDVVWSGNALELDRISRSYTRASVSTSGGLDFSTLQFVDPVSGRAELLLSGLGATGSSRPSIVTVGMARAGSEGSYDLTSFSFSDANLSNPSLSPAATYSPAGSGRISSNGTLVGALPGGTPIAIVADGPSGWEVTLDQYNEMFAATLDRARDLEQDLQQDRQLIFQEEADRINAARRRAVEAARAAGEQRNYNQSVIMLGGSIGTAFGSSLGNIIGGDNVFAQIGA
ncbi:MAG: hypothetical protein K2Y05_04230, partial [Hyphomicrobiaceae bacterium]|nr:hypothetical protein [Hyphomicrobiaceae bacterium]